MKSVMSFPERGKWGKSSWRGNCSGHVQKELIEHYRPKLFVDVCEGSGTSRDVCLDMGIDYRGFDLHTGTDFTADHIRLFREVAINPKSDLLSHASIVPHGIWLSR